MSLISYTQITDGTTIDAADVNSPLNTIYNDYNGNIDGNNISSSSTLSVTSLNTSGNIASVGSVTAGNGFTLSAGTLTLPNNSVAGTALATNSILLGYAKATSNFSTTAVTTSTDITGLTSTVTIPAGGRSVKITVSTGMIVDTMASTAYYELRVLKGSTTIKTYGVRNLTSLEEPRTLVAFDVAPAAGSATYKVAVYRYAAGTFTLNMSATNPSDLIVELV